MTPAERATADWARRRPFGGSLSRPHAPPHRSRCGGRLGSGQDHPHAGAGPGPRRRQRRAPERRRLSPLRPPRAAEPRHLAAAPGRELPRHPHPAPRPPPARQPVLKPVYDHREGTLGRPHYVHPAHYLVVEGLLSFHTETLRLAHDVRVFLAPPEELRRAWKLKRDCTRRGYTTDQVLWELDHRERDAEAFIRPQQAHADIVVSFHSRRARRSRRTWTRRSSCATRCRTRTSRRSSTTRTTARALERGERELLLRIPGDIDPDHAAVLEEAVWERMSFASHLRVRQLGEFTARHRPAALRVARARPGHPAVPPRVGPRGARRRRPPRPRGARARHGRRQRAARVTADTNSPPGS